jgi:hypothetical protein
MDMKLVISSTSATAKIAAGSRVAAEFEKNDWSIGTVVKANPTSYKIDFDYGETHLLKPANIRILQVNVSTKKKMKKPLTYAEVKAISTVAIAKAAKAAETKSAEEAAAAKTAADQKRNALQVKKAKAQAEQLKDQYAAVSEPAQKSLRIWAKQHGFTPKFFATGYPHGFWVLEDRKVRLQVYLYKNVMIYALPPKPPFEYDPKKIGSPEEEERKRNYHNEDDKELDNIEFGKLELPYSEFNAKAIDAFVEQLVAKHGFRFKYLQKKVDPNAAPEVAKPAKPVAKPEPKKSVTVKVVAKPAAVVAVKAKPGIRLKAK